MRYVNQVEQAARQFLPAQVKNVLGRGYNIGRTFQANREFNPADTSEIPNKEPPQHIVLVVIDALRYDYLSERTAPFLWGKKPTKAIASSTWTFPSVSSLLTGRYPHEHKAMRQTDEPNDVTEQELSIPVLASEQQTLSEILGGANIATYGGFGFGTPFLALKSRFRKHRLYRDANAERLLEDNHLWIDKQGDRQTFSYLHLSDLHTPYNPPTEYPEKFDIMLPIDEINQWRYKDVTNPSPNVKQYQEQMRRLYRATLRYVDETISAYYDELKSRFGSDLLLFVTSDHGEGFWDHASFDAEHFYDSRPAYCVGHGGTPYECVTRVPLWVDEIETKNDGLASTVDITPTILEIMGLERELETTGTTLTKPNKQNRLVLSEGTRYGYEKKAIYNNDWKIIMSRGDEVTVETSIEEEPSTKSIPSDVKERMLKSLPPWPNGQIESKNYVSGTVERRLRDLGYQ